MSAATAQEYELDFWGDCCNTYGEETKQLVYARYMGLRVIEGGPGPMIDLAGRSVIDLGGGPTSLLLKCPGLTDQESGPRYAVVDPAPYPRWVAQRYAAHGVHYYREAAEGFRFAHEHRGFDEAWIYNVLQHVDDPARVIAVALESARLLRIFEWVDVPAYPGHPHELSAPGLVGWIDRAGADPSLYRTARLDESGCVGHAFYGVFAA